MFRYAIATGRATRDISLDLRGALAPVVSKNHAAIVELQLAHAERNEVRSACNRAQRLAERRKMMQQWANHLDTLRASIPEATERKG